MEATMSRTRQATTERWARALDRALHAGVEILTTQDGERFATSASHLDLLYRVTPETCECAAGQAGDPVCQHRAALRSIIGNLPVVTVRVDELIPAGAPSCKRCFGNGEHWAGSGVDSYRITCPECQGTGRHLDAIVHAA